MSEPLVKIGPELRQGGPVTMGMMREEAVATDRLWAGFVRTAPESSSGWHHHGVHQTAIYVLAGTLTMEFGPEGRDRFDAGPGDFVFVPSGAIHRESTGSEAPGELIVVRSGTDEAVINVEGPEGPAGG